MPLLHFEDFEAGQEFPLGPVRVTREEIIAFAAEFDPQPFHLDEAAAADTMLGGLAASGWHTCSLFMRMIFEGWLKGAVAMGSPGVDSVRWLAPVRPGDILSGTTKVVATRESRTKPDRGFLRTRTEIANAAGTIVLVVETPIMVGRRGAA